MVTSVIEEFRRLKDELIDEEEIRRAKDHMKGSLMLSLESTSSRMSNLARQEMYFERFFSLDETIEQIESVTAEQVTEMAGSLFQTDKIAVTALGNLDGLKISRDQLEC